MLKLGIYGAAGLATAGAGWSAPAPVTKPAAKAVIQIWMWGGSAHLDTFDPKPAAGRDYCINLLLSRFGGSTQPLHF